MVRDLRLVFPSPALVVPLTFLAYCTLLGTVAAARPGRSSGVDDLLTAISEMGTLPRLLPQAE